MKGKFWTSREDEILRNTIDLTARQLTELLPGRTVSSITQRRIKLKLSTDFRRSPWTSAEDEIIRRTVNLTARQVTDLLPGRTLEAIKYRRKEIGSFARSSTSALSPNQVGSRTLLAKTCPRCGLLLDATWFRWEEKRLDRPGGWSPFCRKCAGSTGSEFRSWKGRKDADASRRVKQALTVDRAHRAGQPWTEADDRVLDNPELTLLEKALKTGRTYNAVQSRCSNRGYTSKVGLGDAVAGQWRIWRVEGAA